MNPDASDASSEPIAGETVRHGTGVNSTRAFPTNAFPTHLDPFVLFERFYIEPDDGFPMHPHRGFEIVSYMLEGGMDHEDSLGVSHTATPGEAMHITAGQGIRHSELPANGAGCSGLQLWINLPREEKDSDPNYADAAADDLSTVEEDGATITTVVGEGSPLEPTTELTYHDVRVTDTWTWTVPDGWTGFLYGVSGEGTVAGHEFEEGDVFPLTESRSVALESKGKNETESELRVVAVAGRPHGEVIQQQGPFVL
ncbi:pirin family protein [Natronolimnobius baerhuensis]|uniref:Pirin n=1 Tax=Natronolimnobius baerhuensis TaxID=253108 RepID=A0A202E9S2_9EURY|nr:pirin family protein [Natronolimnobius baerhuensis]OVE84959.1 pirin [Natronolimnobius baerhuensis]